MSSRKLNNILSNDETQKTIQPSEVQAKEAGIPSGISQGKNHGIG